MDSESEGVNVLFIYFFCLSGIFIAMQRKVIACGMKIAILGLVLRFVVGPALTTLGALAVGLQGNVFQITVIQVTTNDSH